MSEPSLPQMVLVTRGPEGVAATPYTPVDARPSDPYVRQRLAAAGRAEIVTEYSAAPQRPPSYPARLPFLPDRPVFTTETRDGGMSPGARWPCASRDEASAVRAAVERASIEAGWVAVPSLRMPAPHGPSAARVLLREDLAWVLLTADAGRGAVVQLLEVPRRVLRERAF